MGNVSFQWPVLSPRPNSMSMSNMLEDAIANMNLHGIYFLYDLIKFYVVS